MRERSDSTAFFVFWDKAGTVVISNLLWLVCALPLVTLPAATAALFAVLAPIVRGQQAEPFSAFWGGLREHWRKSSLIGLLDLIIFGVIAANFLIFARMDGGQVFTRVSQVVTLFVGVAVLLVNLYLWPLLVLFKLSLPQLVETAARMAFGHALWSLLLLGLVVSYLVIGVQLPGVFMILVYVAGGVLLVNWGAWRVIRRYVTPEELSRLEAKK